MTAAAPAKADRAYRALRRRRREGTLDPAIATVLDLTDPGWDRIEWDRKWDARVQAYRAYVAEHGHAPTLVPGISDADRSLAQWLANVRAVHRRGDLPDDRTADLDAVLGHEWNPKAAAWWGKYQELHDFASEHGRMPRQSAPEERELHHWLINVRAAAKRDKLPDDRRHALEAIPGWAWQRDVNSRWHDNLRRYRAYMEGSREQPLRQLDPSLSTWVVRQRRLHRAGALEPERAAALNSVPGHTWDNAGA